ncbi:hypothetical protein [Pectobacterium carotovorum]|uniref:hypothetical protein n=1 Tax=Pectobacterium carotovorum TaxID=554 RepID=UPI003016E99C
MAKNKPFNFAHLLGIGRNASEDDKDEDEKNKAKKAKSRRAEEENDDDDPDASDDGDDPDAEDGDGDDPDAEDGDGDDPDASDDGDDPDAEDDDGDDPKESRSARKARVAERKRCARIFGSEHAASNPALAASLAFNTGMSSAAAINVLGGSAPAPSVSQQSRKLSLDERMERAHQARLKPDGAAKTRKSALVEQMTGLYNNAKGVRND